MATGPKKVLIVVENQSVPHDTRVWKEALTLRENGYQVTVLCPKNGAGMRTYESLDGVHIYRHPVGTEGNGALGYALEFMSAILWECLFAWWIFFRRGFHVIQGCNPPDTIFLVALPFKLFGVKYIFDHHDAAPELYVAKYGRKGPLHRILMTLERWTYRCSDVVIATNLSYKELAVTRGRVPRNDVFVVRNGPELDKFKAVDPIPALKYGKQFLVGYVGNMSTQDGLDILLEVAAHVKNLGHRDIHFTCVGSGSELAALRQMVDAKGLAEMVNFTGRVSDEVLLQVLSTADVCVNPDRPCEMNDISTMIKIMEYMALGKPIVQFDATEGRFSAQDASLYASNEAQVADFADKILWLLRNPDERKRMGEAGRRRVETQLAWEFSVGNLLAAYERSFSSGVQ